MTSSCKLLLVEDSEETRELYELALARDEFDITACSTATGALEYLESGYMPDLIVCDLLMPGLDGDQFVGVLRSDPRWSMIRIIIVSGVENLRKRALDMGADGFLRKPFSLDNLEEIVNQHAKAPQNA